MPAASLSLRANMQASLYARWHTRLFAYNSWVNRSRTALAYDPASVGADPGAGGARVGLDVIGVVHDGLAGALERVGAGEASALLVARLADAAGSLRELVALLDWLDACDGDLIALDVGLDTATRGGARAARVLREVDRWEREPPPGRPPRGRPGLAHHSPELADRIRTLRAAGESLQAIADLLNEEGVPTPRGGDRWRPSSVQAALGYRRPRPPLPGVPPPSPPPSSSSSPPPPPRYAPRPGHVPRPPGRGPRPPGKPRRPHPRGGRP